MAAKSQIVWTLWTQFASALRPFSQVLQQMANSKFEQDHAERFLNQFAATTLMRYMQSVLQFVQICHDLQVSIQDLSESILADLLICSALARRSDGSGPKHSVTIKALKWCCKQLDVSAFAPVFGPLIASFDRQKIPSDRRESLPFPLFILMKWERRILQAQSTPKEIIILGGLLLLCWSGLRFSDIQRSQLNTWFLDSTSLRGLTWRAKTCSTATPFGVCISGLLSQGSWTWIHKFLQTLDQLYAAQNPADIDFAIPSFNGREEPALPFDAMSYAEALYYIRWYMRLPWSPHSAAITLDASSYTVHGLKATLLSWAAQTDISPEDRRMHGKHKPAQMSVQLYSRDDIIGSLRLQQELISRISQGWRPTTPLARGGQSPLVEPMFTLEKFKKNVSDLEWNFFSFSQSSSLQDLVDTTVAHDDTVVDLPSSGDESSSSTSSSSTSSGSVRPPTAKRRGMALPHDEAEECWYGLHRHTWHVMVRNPVESDQLPHIHGIALKTACGRQLNASRMRVSMDLHLEPQQLLCSHIGCRKGFLLSGMGT